MRRLFERSSSKLGSTSCSKSDVFVRVLPPSCLLVPQRAIYAGDEPFIESWRKAMGYLVREDRNSGYSQLWMKLQAMSWNKPELRAHLVEVNEGWRAILREAFTKALERYGVDTTLYPVEGIVALTMTFNQGFQLEQTGGIETGHDAILKMIDEQLVRWEKAASESDTPKDGKNER